MQEKIIVIGAGTGGIAVAIHLAAAGHQVTVYEQASQAGGKLNQITQEGYRFDTGPSLFTLPTLVDELFKIANYDVQNKFRYKKLENICKYHYEDGTVLNALADPQKFAQEAAQVLNEPEENVKQYLTKARDMYDLAAGMFIFRPFARLETFKSEAGKRVAKKLHKLDMMLSMHQRNQKSFRSNKLVKLFDRYATYNGSNPYQAPATLNMIAHLEHNEGAFFPEKGMYSIIEHLVEAAKNLNVEFHFNKRIDKVLLNNKTAQGVVVDGKTLKADRIISDMDISAFYRNLMPRKKIPWHIRLMEKSTSAVIFYWGITTTFPHLELHNILFAENYHEEFKYLFKKKKLYYDPTTYIFISNKITKNDAPVGCENWFVMINAPINKGQYSKDAIQTIRRHIIEKIDRVLKTDIEQHIETERIGTPVSIEEQTASEGGAIYGNSSNSKFSAFLRHPNRSKKFRKLHFVGGSVHPGGGIPLCIASAGIVSTDIKNEKQINHEA